MRSRSQYEQTVTVTCSDNGKSNTAEVLNFIAEQRLSVSLNRSVKLEMIYNPRNKLYIASQGGLEFVSKGPEEIVYTEMRRR